MLRARRLSRVALKALLFAACLGVRPAAASGGEHVVDDSEVEAAGSCHLETWTTQARRGLDLLNLGPSCTPAWAPRLEFGGVVQRVRAVTAPDTLYGPALKATLRPEASGWGLGVDGDALWSARSGRALVADLYATLTLHPAKGLRLNLNAGGQWDRVDGRTRPYAGVQAEVSLPHDLSLMAETFARQGGRAGQQLGLRWTPKRGRVDYDVVVGRRVDGLSDEAVSLGITLRR